MSRLQGFVCIYFISFLETYDVHQRSLPRGQRPVTGGENFVTGGEMVPPLSMLKDALY